MSHHQDTATTAERASETEKERESENQHENERENPRISMEIEVLRMRERKISATEERGEARRKSQKSSLTVHSLLRVQCLRYL